MPRSNSPAATSSRGVESARPLLPWGLIVYVAAIVIAASTLLATNFQQPFLPLTAWRIALGALSNVTCALLGCYLVLRRMSLLGDAISHAVLPGIVVAFVLSGTLGGPWMLLGAFAVGLLTAWLIQALSGTGRVAEDSSMGIVYTGLFALGVLLLSYFARHVHLDVDCALFGHIDYATATVNSLATPPRGLWPLLAVHVAAVLMILICWKELKIVAFDAPLARAMGIPVGLIHYGLMAMVAVAAVASFEVVGSILVVAMLIVPAATATLLTDRLAPMLAWAAAIAVGSALVGDLIADALNTNVPGMMTVVAGAHLAAAVFLAPRTGLLSRWWRNWQLALRIVREDILAKLYREEEHGVPVPRALPWLAKVARWQLLQQGLLSLRQGTIELTSSGREAARSIVRAHRLWETYLQKHFQLPPDHLHEPAERMEHFLDETLLAELTAELDGQTHDPHGRAIPVPDSASPAPGPQP